MEDSEIVNLYWARDEMALEETSRQYGGYCRSIARSILGNDEDTEECLNDTWLRAWNAIPPQRPRKLMAFLGRITRNLAFDRIRADVAGKRGGGELPLVLEELGECVSGEDSTEDSVLTEELGQAINSFLASLSSRDRSVFLRRYFSVSSVSEIGRVLGLKEANVFMILSRTRRKLRETLEKEGYL